ncbi:MAG: glycosyltransferase [Desulfamplus sp.]|nr:glycosyltransferase [Desulfamplus sp.]
MKKKNITLSACMIVKNEEAMLQRCLNSIKNLVDEIIIVDTGSTDKTLEIANSFGAKIYHHPWEDDFSKHRNQSISYATGDWILVIDADEELDAAAITKNKLKEILKKKSKNENALLITILEKISDGEVGNRTKSVRFFRSHAGLTYRGIVQNTPEYKGRAGELELSLVHYGYSLPDAQMQERYKRTSYLLHQRVEQNPDDYPAYFYLSQLYMQMNEDDKGVEYAQKCLNLLRNVKNNDKDVHFFYAIYHILALTLINQGDYKLALEIVQEGLERLPDNIDLFYDLACTGFFLNDQDMIIKSGERYLNLVDHYKNELSHKNSYPDNVKSIDSVTSVLSTTTPEAMFSVLFWLMTAYIALRQLDRYGNLWNSFQEHFKEQLLDRPELYEKLLSDLEEADGWDYLEKTLAVNSTRHNSYSEEHEKNVLKYHIFISRRAENYESLESTIKKYQDLMINYEEMPLSVVVVIAESLLKQNKGKEFLEISAFLMRSYGVESQLDSVKSTDKLALAYSIIAHQQDQNQKGKITALACLNIAWILTDDQHYLESIGSLKKTGSLQTEKIEGKDPIKESTNISESNSHSSSIQIDHPSSIDTIAESDDPASFRTSFGDFNITPKISDTNPVFLQGIAGKERKAIGIDSLLRMQILLIEDENQTKILFVSADIFGFGSEMVELIRKDSLKWGITPERVILNASHTHYAPGTLSHTFRTMGPYFEEYSMEIAGIVGNALPMLHDNLEHSYIYSGGTNVNIGISSVLEKNGSIEFEPDEAGSYDQHTPFLLFELKKSNKKIIMVNHGCQPTGLGIENNISADFPGYFRDELIKTSKIDHVMYLQGASGDIKEAATFNGSRVLSTTSQDAQTNGRNMAQCIKNALDNALLKPLTESIISSTSKTMYLKLKKIPDINRINELKSDILSDPVIREWASRLSTTYPSGDFPNALALDVQVALIGKHSTFICFPAGPISKLGIELKKLTNSPENCFILGYTNGLLCYLPDDNKIELGGYESDISPYYYMIPYLLAKGVAVNIISNVTNCYSKVLSAIPIRNSNIDEDIQQLPQINDKEFINTTQSKVPIKIVNKKIPTVSIGMPVYNMKDTVKEAIDTILNQTFSDFELIISDNASDDGTEEICRAAAKEDSRIIYNRNQKNILGENARLTFLISKGKYFMWAAADDARKPEMVKRCVDTLEADNEAILAYTYTEVLDPANSVRRFYYDPYSLDQNDPADRYTSLITSLDLGNMMYGLYRRSAMYSLPPIIGNPSTVMIFTDAILLTHIVLQGKIVQIPEMLFIRRRGESKPWLDNLARIESQSSHNYLQKGVTLPVSDSIIEHVRILLESTLPAEKKLHLIQVTYDAYTTRFGTLLDFEIDRAIKLAKEGKFTESWNGMPPKHPDKAVQKQIDQEYAGLLLERLERASRFIHNHKGIYMGKSYCLAKMGRRREAELQIELANELSELSIQKTKAKKP